MSDDPCPARDVEPRSLWKTWVPQLTVSREDTRPKFAYFEVFQRKIGHYEGNMLVKVQKYARGVQGTAKGIKKMR